MRGWGPRVAIPAAVLLAISGQHLVYSREPLVEADGLFFATLAALVYLRARGGRGLLAAGVLWGVAFACNNRLSYLPAVFVLAELARWPGWRRASAAAGHRRGLPGPAGGDRGAPIWSRAESVARPARVPTGSTTPSNWPRSRA